MRVPGGEVPVEPSIRVGLVVGAGAASVSGAEGLSVSDPSGARLAEIPAGEVWRVAVQGSGVAVLAPGGASTAPADVFEISSPNSNAPVLVNGRPYRGTIIALRDDFIHLRVPPDNLRIEVSRSSVVSVTTGEEAAKTA